MTTILVVDDNAMDRKVAGIWVEKAGWQAEFAENGSEALERIGRESPDLVLTDLQMPEMDGLELVRRVNASFPGTPIVLMTAHGSEELAVTALRTGASSYVPKRNLHRDLRDALQVVLDASESRRQRQRLLEVMTASCSQFSLGHDQEGPRALVSYCQDALQLFGVWDESTTRRVGTALLEALVNAIDHGNLELSSALRECDDEPYDSLRERRRQESPYRDRRVLVEVLVTRDEVKCVIRDEGPGFDPSSLPDPTDPENLLKPSGRGVLLMRTFMDDVTFNDCGNEVTMLKRRGD